MKKVTSLILFILLGISMISCSNNKNKIRADIYFKKASKVHKNNLLNKDSISAAINLVDSAIIYDPQNIDYLLTKGQFSFEIGNYDLAIKNADEILKIQNENFLAEYQKGIAFDILGNQDSANANYRVSLQILNNINFKTDIYKEYQRYNIIWTNWRAREL